MSSQELLYELMNADKVKKQAQATAQRESYDKELFGYLAKDENAFSKTDIAAIDGTESSEAESVQRHMDGYGANSYISESGTVYQKDENNNIVVDSAGIDYDTAQYAKDKLKAVQAKNHIDNVDTKIDELMNKQDLSDSEEIQLIELQKEKELATTLDDSKMLDKSVMDVSSLVSKTVGTGKTSKKLLEGGYSTMVSSDDEKSLRDDTFGTIESIKGFMNVDEIRNKLIQNLSKTGDTTLQTEETFESFDALLSSVVNLTGKFIKVVSPQGTSVNKLGEKLERRADDIVGYNPEDANKALAVWNEAWETGDTLKILGAGIESIYLGGPQMLAQSVPYMAVAAGGVAAVGSTVPGVITTALSMATVELNNRLDKRANYAGKDSSEREALTYKELSAAYAVEFANQLIQYGAMELMLKGGRIAGKEIEPTKVISMIKNSKNDIAISTKTKEAMKTLTPDELTNAVARSTAGESLIKVPEALQKSIAFNVAATVAKHMAVGAEFVGVHFLPEATAEMLDQAVDIIAIKYQNGETKDRTFVELLEESLGEIVYAGVQGGAMGVGVTAASRGIRNAVEKKDEALSGDVAKNTFGHDLVTPELLNEDTSKDWMNVPEDADKAHIEEVKKAVIDTTRDTIDEFLNEESTSVDKTNIRNKLAVNVIDAFQSIAESGNTNEAKSVKDYRQRFTNMLMQTLATHYTAKESLKILTELAKAEPRTSERTGKHLQDYVGYAIANTNIFGLMKKAAELEEKETQGSLSDGTKKSYVTAVNNMLGEFAELTSSDNKSVKALATIAKEARDFIVSNNKTLTDKSVAVLMDMLSGTGEGGRLSLSDYIKDAASGKFENDEKFANFIKSRIAKSVDTVSGTDSYKPDSEGLNSLTKKKGSSKTEANPYKTQEEMQSLENKFIQEIAKLYTENNGDSPALVDLYAGLNDVSMRTLANKELIKEEFGLNDEIAEELYSKRVPKLTPKENKNTDRTKDSESSTKSKRTQIQEEMKKEAVDNKDNISTNNNKKDVPSNVVRIGGNIATNGVKKNGESVIYQLDGHNKNKVYKEATYQDVVDTLVGTDYKDSAGMILGNIFNFKTKSGKNLREAAYFIDESGIGRTFIKFGSHYYSITGFNKDTKRFEFHRYTNKSGKEQLTDKNFKYIDLTNLFSKKQNETISVRDGSHKIVDSLMEVKQDKNAETKKEPKTETRPESEPKPETDKSTSSKESTGNEDTNKEAKQGKEEEKKPAQEKQDKQNAESESIKEEDDEIKIETEPTKQESKQEPIVVSESSTNKYNKTIEHINNIINNNTESEYGKISFIQKSIESLKAFLKSKTKFQDLNAKDKKSNIDFNTLTNGLSKKDVNRLLDILYTFKDNNVGTAKEAKQFNNELYEEFVRLKNKTSKKSSRLSTFIDSVASSTTISDSMKVLKESIEEYVGNKLPQFAGAKLGEKEVFDLRDERAFEEFIKEYVQFDSMKLEEKLEVLANLDNLVVIAKINYMIDSGLIGDKSFIGLLSKYQNILRAEENTPYVLKEDGTVETDYHGNKLAFISFANSPKNDDGKVNFMVKAKKIKEKTLNIFNGLVSAETKDDVLTVPNIKENLKTLVDDDTINIMKDTIKDNLFTSGIFLASSNVAPLKTLFDASSGKGFVITDKNPLHKIINNMSLELLSNMSSSTKQDENSLARILGLDGFEEVDSAKYNEFYSDLYRFNKEERTFVGTEEIKRIGSMVADVAGIELNLKNATNIESENIFHTSLGMLVLDRLISTGIVKAENVVSNYSGQSYRTIIIQNSIFKENTKVVSAIAKTANRYAEVKEPIFEQNEQEHEILEPKQKGMTKFPKNSSTYKDAKRKSNKPYYANKFFTRLFTKGGDSVNEEAKENLMIASGAYTDEEIDDIDNLRIEQYIQKKGKSDTVAEFFNVIDEYASELNEASMSVPEAQRLKIFLRHVITSTGRLYVDSKLDIYSNKVHRSILAAEDDLEFTLTKDNFETMMLGIAQQIGIDIDKKSDGKALEELISNYIYFNKDAKTLKELVSSINIIDMDLKDAFDGISISDDGTIDIDKDTATFSRDNEGLSTLRALTTLFDVIEHNKQNESYEEISGLEPILELDGITSGVSIQMTSNGFVHNYTGVLSKEDDAVKKVMEETGKDFEEVTHGDIKDSGIDDAYEQVAELLKKSVTLLFDTKQDMFKKIKEKAPKTISKHFDSIFVPLFDSVINNDLANYLKRSTVKTPTTGAGYGAGSASALNSFNINIVKEMLYKKADIEANGIEEVGKTIEQIAIGSKLLSIKNQIAREIKKLGHEPSSQEVAEISKKAYTSSTKTQTSVAIPIFGTEEEDARIINVPVEVNFNNGVPEAYIVLNEYQTTQFNKAFNITKKGYAVGSKVKLSTWFKGLQKIKDNRDEYNFYNNPLVITEQTMLQLTKLYKDVYSIDKSLTKVYDDVLKFRMNNKISMKLIGDVFAIREFFIDTVKASNIPVSDKIRLIANIEKFGISYGSMNSTGEYELKYGEYEANEKSTVVGVNRKFANASETKISEAGSQVAPLNTINIDANAIANLNDVLVTAFDAFKVVNPERGHSAAHQANERFSESTRKFNTMISMLKKNIDSRQFVLENGLDKELNTYAIKEGLELGGLFETTNKKSENLQYDTNSLNKLLINKYRMFKNKINFGNYYSVDTIDGKQISYTTDGFEFNDIFGTTLDEETIKLIESESSNKDNKMFSEELYKKIVHNLLNKENDLTREKIINEEMFSDGQPTGTDGDSKSDNKTAEDVYTQFSLYDEGSTNQQTTLSSKDESLKFFDSLFKGESLSSIYGDVNLGTHSLDKIIQDMINSVIAKYGKIKVDVGETSKQAFGYSKGGGHIGIFNSTASTMIQSTKELIAHEMMHEGLREAFKKDKKLLHDVAKLKDAVYKELLKDENRKHIFASDSTKTTLEASERLYEYLFSVDSKAVNKTEEFFIYAMTNPKLNSFIVNLDGNVDSQLFGKIDTSEAKLKIVKLFYKVLNKVIAMINRIYNNYRQRKNYKDVLLGTYNKAVEIQTAIQNNSYNKSKYADLMTYLNSSSSGWLKKIISVGHNDFKNRVLNGLDGNTALATAYVKYKDNRSASLIKFVMDLYHSTVDSVEPEKYRKFYKLFNYIKQVNDVERNAEKEALRVVLKDMLKSYKEDEFGTLKELLIDTDLNVLLDSMSYDKVVELVSNKNKINNRIDILEEILYDSVEYQEHDKFINAVIQQSKGLAKYMIHKKIYLKNQMFNPTLISIGKFMTKEDFQQHPELISVPNLDTSVIDELVTLYALKEVESWNKTELLTRDKEAIENVLKEHGRQVEHQLEIASKYDATYYVKGIEHAEYDIDSDVVSTNDEKKKKWLRRSGYKEIYSIEDDSVFAYIGTHKKAYTKGIIEIADTKTDIGTHAESKREESVYTDFYTRELPDKETYAYRLDSHSVKREFNYNNLERVISVPNSIRVTSLRKSNNIVDVLVGNLSNMEEIEAGAKYNMMAIEEANEEYKRATDVEKKAFYNISLGSKEWKKLPTYTKDMLKKKGIEDIYVRANILNDFIGYQNIRTREFIEKLKIKNPAAYKGALFLMDHLEDFIKILKPTLVIKDIFVVGSNFLSNFFHLVAKGLNPIQSSKDFFTAARLWQDLKNDLREIAKLKVLRGSDNSNRLNRRINHIKERLLNNPLYELHNRGLISSMVDDESVRDMKDKNLVLDKLNKVASRLGIPEDSAMRDIVKTVYVHTDTKFFRFLLDMTQLGDASARYAYYNHLKTNSNMSEDEIYSKIASEFVMYNKNENPLIQFFNTFGFEMFTKYLFKNIGVQGRLILEHPVGATLSYIGVSAGLPTPMQTLLSIENSGVADTISYRSVVTSPIDTLEAVITPPLIREVL